MQPTNIERESAIIVTLPIHDGFRGLDIIDDWYSVEPFLVNKNKKFIYQTQVLFGYYGIIFTCSFIKLTHTAILLQLLRNTQLIFKSSSFDAYLTQQEERPKEYGINNTRLRVLGPEYIKPTR